jgi:hypothetical protein
MKIFKTILITTLLASSVVKAQNYTVKWGPLMEVSKTDYVDGFIYADKDQVTILKKNLKSNTITGIEKYNKDFKLLYRKELTSTDKYTSLLYASYTGENIQSLMKVTNPKAKTSTYNVMTIGDAASAKASEWKMATVDFSEKGASYNSLSYNSPDYKKRVYVIEGNSTSAKFAKDKEFVIAVVDENGKKLWQKTITNKGIMNNTSTIDELAVNKNGDVVLVEKREDPENKGGKIKFFASSKDYDYFLYIFTNNGNDYKKININIGGNKIESVNTEVNRENDNFQFAGMYSNGKRGVIQGVFAGEIDSKGDVVKSNQKDFSDSFLDSFKKGSTAKERGDDNEGLSPNFKLRRFFSREDGGGYLVFEYYKLVITTTTSSSGRTSTRYTYYYNDIIVTSIDPAGKIDWNYRIPKTQVSGSYVFSSIVPFISGNNLGIIYNENPKNMDNEFSESFKKVNFKECVGIVRTLDPSGKLVSDVLFKNKDFNILLQPRMCEQTSPNTVAIYGGKFGMFSIKDARLGTVEISK